MSIDTAYSTSDSNVGKVILHTGTAVSRTPITTIGNIPLDTTMIKVPTMQDRLTNSSLNSHSLELFIPGRIGNLELLITKPPSTSIDYKSDTIFHVSVSKDQKSKFANYKTVSNEPYSASFDVKYKRVGLPVNIYALEGNHINYPTFSLTNFSRSRSTDSKALSKIFSLTAILVKKNSISNDFPSTFFTINTDIAYSYGDIKLNALTLPSTTIHVAKAKNSWTTSILNYDKCFITVFNKPKISIQIPHSNNPVIFDLPVPTNFNVSEPIKQRDVDTVRFVVQKDSFVELYIKFTSNIITNVVGLPEGLYFDNNYIKGSPTIAGKYNIKIMCYEQTIMEGIIEVPNVPRKF